MSDDSTKDDGLSEDGFSSEDLLRDAKEKFGLDDGSSGVAESLLESSIGESVDESAEPMPSVDEIAAELAASRTEDIDFAMTPDTDFEVAEDTDFTPGGTEDLLQHSADDPAVPVDRPPTASRVTREEVTAARHESLEPDSIQRSLRDFQVLNSV